MRSVFALLVYCLVFSCLFVCFYPVLFSENAHDPGNKASVVLAAAVDQRQRSVLSHRDRDPALPNAEAAPRPPPIPIVQDCPEVPKPLLDYVPMEHSVPLTDKEKLLGMCKQSSVISLTDFFSEVMVATITKIGEGAFADVFGCYADDWKQLALKIIPVEGDFKYNDEPQSSLKEVQPETVVSIELSLLGDKSRRENRAMYPHFTTNFMQIPKVGLCQGKFPQFLLEAWDDYDYRKKSDNDRPSVFPENQLYVVFAAENAGSQLGSYVYHSFEEAISILRQVSGTVAVGEAALEFEHRDLHRGNVLVKRTHEETVYLRLGGVDYLIPTHGVQATIVDYTLSRIKQGECVSHNNLNNLPWLFKGKGDIQFDVYRDMRNASHSHWDKFTPYTNVLWINYLTTKISIKGKLKGVSSKTWKDRFTPYLKEIKKCSSAREIFSKVFAPGAQIKPSSTHRIKSKH